jgi:DNA-binding NtrC family response regulator
MDVIKVLVIDDEKSILDVISTYLSGFDELEVYKADNHKDAFDILSHNSFEIAIIDIKLPDISGIEILRYIKEKYNQTEVIMISGHGDMETVIECMRGGAIDYFSKPFELRALYLSIVRTCQFISLKRELKHADILINELSKNTQDNPGQFLSGSGKLMQKVLSDVTNYAKSDNGPVLITGGTGTGKEVAARHIHNLSKRNDKGFFAFNCAAVPEQLFESELFGYRKGAFSGADQDKAGWFEIANRGTLFLDEIAEMPIMMQTKLLRVIEEQKIWKLGAIAPVHVDVRIIAATNHNIGDAIAKGRFRSDLFYRLNVFEISMPLLKDRPEDIPELITTFLRHFALSMGKKIPVVAQEVIDMLKNYDFPGNVRQLRNMIERAVILCSSGKITHKHISIPNSDLMYSEDSDKIAKTLDLESNEKLLIEMALATSGYNKSKAASKLGITIQSLLRRIEKYHINV